MNRSLSHWIVRQWRTPSLAGSLLLLPPSWIFGALVVLRRGLYRFGLKPIVRLPIPVLVVGNLTVGGSGKTPLVIHLVQALRQAGRRPGVVSRGYGGVERGPRRLEAEPDPADCGDEPALIALRTGCPVAVGADRTAAARLLLADCDVIVADDGLQHYALGRDVEIAVVDGDRGLGNGRLLPAGPLREPRGRLHQVDFVAVRDPEAEEYGPGPDAYAFRVWSATAYPLTGAAAPRPLADWVGCRVHAVAGIGVPERFFGPLEDLGLDLERHPYRDHHAFVDGDLAYGDTAPILMTEKDAVKCRAFADKRMWVVPVEVDDEADLAGAIVHHRALRNAQLEERNGSAPA